MKEFRFFGTFYSGSIYSGILYFTALYFLEGIVLYFLFSWIYFQEILFYVPFFISFILIFMLACISYIWLNRSLSSSGVKRTVSSGSSFFFSHYYGLIACRFVFFVVAVLGIFYFDSVRIVDYLIIYVVYFLVFLKTESIGFYSRFYKESKNSSKNSSKNKIETKLDKKTKSIVVSTENEKAERFFRRIG